MLEIKIPATDLWDEATQEFVYTKDRTLRLEHSLVSLAKWERKWCKAFLSKREKTNEEIRDYVRCMTIDKNVDPNIYNCLSSADSQAIKDYLEAPMTAIYFPKENKNTINGETVTHELIYYWMITLNIPFECEKWHLTCLINLIRVCNLKNGSGKKMSKRDLLSRNAAVNATRRAKLNSNG